ARLEYLHALHLYPAANNNWQTPVLTCSALNNSGINEIWDTIQSYVQKMQTIGFWEQNRQRQNVEWLHTYIRQSLEDEFYNNPTIKDKFSSIKENILSGKMLPIQGAKELLDSAKSAN
ncbi:MAG TPA: methylmalonyl Co-A mutase-associated GTPase MeaB, partial [Emticicia sp.]